MNGMPAPIGPVSTWVLGGGYRRRAAFRLGTEAAQNAKPKRHHMHPALRRTARGANNVALWLYR
jgi:hypothetical protein